MSRQALADGKVTKARSSTSVLSGFREGERDGRADDALERTGQQWAPRHDFSRLRVHNTQVPAIQPKLKMSSPGDKYEQEADRIADQVLRMPDSEVGTKTPSVTPIQTHSVQRDASSGHPPTVTPSIQSKIEGLQRCGGAPLSENVRSIVEPKLGHDLSDVKVHRNSMANNVAEGLHARALTIGNHVIFGKHQYPAGNEANNRLLNHELVHTVQQEGGDQATIQRAPAERSSLEDENDAISKSEADDDFEQAPEEDIIRRGSKLAKQLNRLFRRMGSLLFDLVGRPGDNEVSLGTQIFSAKQLAKARRAASRYANASRLLQRLRVLDVAYAAQWLDRVLSTLRILRRILNEVERSGGTFAEFVKLPKARIRKIAASAKMLRKNPAFIRGAALGAKAVAEAEQAALKTGLANITSATQLQTVGMSDVETEIEIQKLELNKEINPAKAPVIDAIVEGLESGRVEERRRQAPETPLVALEDRLSTVESLDREDAAQLITRMDQLDLTRLAETKNRDRLGKLGLQLAEATRGQTATGVGIAAIPFIGPFLARPAEIVSERFEEKRAVERLAAAVVLAGGTSELIHVPDREQLTNLKITRTGDDITFWKTDRLHELEHLNPSTTGSSEIPQREWTFEPSDLVTLSVPGSGESVTLPAFAWLHMEDVGLQATFQEWASLFGEGAAFTKASIKATSKAVRPEASGLATAPPTPSTPTRGPPPAGPPRIPGRGGSQPSAVGGGRPQLALPPGPKTLPEPGRIAGGAQRTTPMNPPNPNVGPPAAFAKKASVRADVATKQAAKAENDAALILEKAGFEVQQLKDKSGFLDKTITTRVGGKRVTRVFDTLAPTTPRVENVMDRISEKVGRWLRRTRRGEPLGSPRLVLYLRDSPVSLKELKAELLKNPQVTEGLAEILAVKSSGEVVHFWP